MFDKILYLIPLAAIFGGAAVGAFYMQKNQGSLPIGRDTLKPFLEYQFNHRKYWLIAVALVDLFLGGAVAFILLCFVIVPMYGLVKHKGPKAATKEQLANQAVIANKQWLAGLGPNVAERAKVIDAMFIERSKTIIAHHFELWATYSGDHETQYYLAFAVSRSLAAMTDQERGALRIAEHLNSIAEGGNERYRGWRAAVVWGDGKGQVYGQYQWLGLDESNAIADYMRRRGMSLHGVINAIATEASTLVANPATDPTLRAVCQSSLDEIAGRPPVGGSGANSGFFLKSSEVPTTLYAVSSPYAIQLGLLDDGTPLSYSGSRALVTIAPPGSGKSQCHVIPNLLQWRGPAVILDVKGELYAATSKWRAANVGPVFRFAPTDPARSAHYNPLTFINADPDHIWQESRFLTDMLIVPSGNKDNSFWDSKAKELVSAAVAYVCYAYPSEQRSMSRLLDIIHGGAPFDEMLVGLRTAVDVRAMVLAGTSLAEMNEKTRSDVLATVQTSFHGWGDAPVTRVTDRSDWSPLDLRNGSDGKHPTVYICLKSSEIGSYLSILRVFIAQHIRMLTADQPSESDRDKVLPILFLLDELPRLQEMPPVAEAIEIGASYGLRIWMFAQSLGQLQKAYPNADGMIGACAVRAYMNPSGEDKLSEKLSEQLGYVSTMADGTRKRMVEASELAGPDWEKSILVLASSTRPARLKKNFAHQNPEMEARKGSL